MRTILFFLVIFCLLNFITFCYTTDDKQECNPETESFCFNVNNLTFKKNIWEKYSKEDIVKAINSKIEKKKQYSKNIEVKLTENNEMKFFAKEEIQQNSVLQQFSVDSGIIANVNFQYNSFHKSSQLYKMRQQIPDLNAKQEKSGPFIAIVHQFLVHLYNIEESKWKEELLLLPQNIQDIPIFTLRDEELNLIKTETNAYNVVKNMRQLIIATYQDFKRIIYGTWKKELLDILYNKQPITLEDYSYAAYLAVSHCPQNKYWISGFSASLGMNEKQKVFPFPVKENKKEKNQALIQIIANQNYEAGQELIFDMHEQQVTFYYVNNWLNETPTNIRDCQIAILFNNKTAQLYNHDTQYCLKNGTLFHFYTLGNRINMNSKDYQQCNNILKRKLKEHYEKEFIPAKDVIIYNECVHPKWHEQDIFAIVQKQFEDRLDNYYYLIKKLTVYIEQMAEQNLPKFKRNGEQLLVYIKQKLYTANLLISEMNRYKEINQLYENQIIKPDNTEQIEEEELDEENWEIQDEL